METLAVKLYPETLALFRKLKEQSDHGTTMDTFMSYLLEAAQNPQKIEVPVRTQEDAELISSQVERISLLEQQNQDLTIKLTEAGVIPPNMIMFQITDEEIKEIQTLKAYIKMRRNLDLTDADALYLLIRDRKLVR